MTARPAGRADACSGLGGGEAASRRRLPTAHWQTPSALNRPRVYGWASRWKCAPDTWESMV